MTKPRSPFDWNTGAPSIFLAKPSKNQFNGADANRSAMQTRVEPRPLYLQSDSVYLQRPKVIRKFPK